MEMCIVAVRDNRVEAYMQPTFVHHKGAAIRAFLDHCRDDKSDFIRHPEDFDLYFLGSFDDKKGGFLPPPSGEPERLCRAIDTVTKS